MPSRRPRPFAALAPALLGGALAAALAVPAAPLPAQNVALGAPVTLSGTFGVLRPGSAWAPAPAPAPASTITDGVFLAEGTVWTAGTVWWDASVSGSENNAIVVDLGSVLLLDRVRGQFDDNDTYLVDFRTGTVGAWSGLVTFGPVNTFGMVTRPDAVLGGLAARQIRIRGSNVPGGDSYYAVSELQASVVPEPATVTLVALGLLALGAGVRRRRD